MEITLPSLGKAANRLNYTAPHVSSSEPQQGIQTVSNVDAPNAPNDTIAPVAQHITTTRKAVSLWEKTKNKMTQIIEKTKIISAEINTIVKATAHGIKKIVPTTLLVGCSMVPQELPNNTASHMASKVLPIPTISTTTTNSYNKSNEDIPENILTTLQNALETLNNANDPQNIALIKTKYLEAYNGYAVHLMETNGTIFPELLAFPMPKDNPQKSLIEAYAKKSLLEVLKNAYSFLDIEGADLNVITEQTVQWIASLSLDENQFSGSIGETNFQFSSPQFINLSQPEKLLSMANYIQYLKDSSHKGEKNEKSSLFPFLQTALSAEDFAKKIALLFHYPTLVPHKAKPIKIDNGSTLSRENLEKYISQKFEHFLGSPIIPTIDDFVTYSKNNPSAKAYSSGNTIDISSYPLAFQTIVHTIFDGNVPGISSPFGMRVHPTLGKHINHKGIDFATPTGILLYAPFKGTVIKAGWNGGYGKTVTIQNDQGTQILLAHLSSIEVKEGDAVETKTLIAHSGNTGNSTGPHVHLEMRKENKDRDKNENKKEKVIDPKTYGERENHGDNAKTTKIPLHRVSVYQCNDPNQTKPNADCIGASGEKVNGQPSIAVDPQLYSQWEGEKVKIVCNGVKMGVFRVLDKTNDRYAGKHVADIHYIGPNVLWNTIKGDKCFMHSSTDPLVQYDLREVPSNK